MFEFLYKIAAVTYNFLDMFGLYTAVFAFTSAGIAHLLRGGDNDG